MANDKLSFNFGSGICGNFNSDEKLDCSSFRSCYSKEAQRLRNVLQLKIKNNGYVRNDIVIVQKCTPLRYE